VADGDLVVTIDIEMEQFKADLISSMREIKSGKAARQTKVMANCSNHLIQKKPRLKGERAGAKCLKF
jgi:hypothetical protein